MLHSGPNSVFFPNLLLPLEGLGLAITCTLSIFDNLLPVCFLYNCCFILEPETRKSSFR